MKIKIDTATASRLDIIGLNAMFAAMAKDFVDATIVYGKEVAPVVEKAARQMGAEAVKIAERLETSPPFQGSHSLSDVSRFARDPGFGVYQCPAAPYTAEEVEAERAANAQPVIEPSVVKENLTTETDINGIAWDERIHSSSKALNADKTWRRRKNITDEAYNAVMAELKGQSEIRPTSEPVEKIDTPETDDIKGPIEAAKRDEWEGAVEQPPVETTDVEPVKSAEQERQSPSAFMLASDPTALANPNDPDPMLRPADTEPEDDDIDGPKDLEDQLEDALNASETPPQPSPAPAGKLSLFWQYVGQETQWDDVKRHFSRLTGLDDWQAMTTEQQNAIRAEVWHKIGEKNISVDHTADPTAFFCWMYAQDKPERADDVEAAFRVLQGEPIYKNNLTDNQRAGIQTAVSAHLAHLRA